MSAILLDPIAAPPLSPALREHLLRGLRASIRRDQTSAHYLALAGQPHDALLRRIARQHADLAELEGI